MLNRSEQSLRTVSGLRTRFFPRNRISHGLVSMGPWLDLVLLAILFVLVDSRVALAPGIRVDLPQSTLPDGSRPHLVVVVLSVDGAGDGRRREIVFFDDERFRVEREDQMLALREAMSSRSRHIENAELLIQSDQRVNHGTVVRLMNLAAEAGIAKVNLASQPL